MEDVTRLSNSDAPTILSGSDDATRLSAHTSSSWPTGDGQRLTAGQSFGPYVIQRLLGHGGMGEVYEAEQVETGRRVALKLLRGMLDQREDRARFLSEGRLAASVSHPHTVYIFGSEEIDGMPVISMQLLPGGTLKDVIVERGPMSTTEAVAAILDVIGGLDAAASVGILHRDIKPSNCFVDADGSVKVGDFGLSISTTAQSGSKGFQGTPQYAPPEQLRGEPLDVRADIYAVGATLFYLLTGRAPFDARDLQTLVDDVKNTPPPLANTVRKGIPPALSALINRCLSKAASGRPASYSELAKLLQPFAGLVVPARRTPRLLAWLIDTAILALPLTMIKSSTTIRSPRSGVSTDVNMDPWPIVATIVFFAVCEGWWAATPGKRICGLRVVSKDGELSWRQAFARAVMFQSPQFLTVAIALIVGQSAFVAYLLAHPALAGISSLGPLVLTALLFATMRRTNGLAAVHDLVTGTRVVQRRREDFRTSAATDSMAVPADASTVGARRLGSFEVGRALGEVPEGRLYEGVDVALRRRVWIVESTAGAAEVSRARRDANRVGRLHWLAGRRSAAETSAHAETNGNWDAFEAPMGAAIDQTPGASPWPAVRGWLRDLTAELTASERDGVPVVLALDHVWIRHDGRAVLLDFPAPGTGDFPAPGTDTKGRTAPTESVSAFLAAVGRLANAADPSSPMPVSAVAMIDRWAKRKSALSVNDAEADLVVAMTSPDRVSRGRRLTPIALGAAPVILMLILTVVAVKTIGRGVSAQMIEALAVLSEIEKETDPVRQRAIETYAAGTFRPELEDNVAWSFMIDKDDDKEVPRLREVARRVAALAPTPAETAAAAELIRPTLDRIGQRNSGNSPETIFLALVMVGSAMSFFGGIGSVLIRPSGFVLSALGLAVVVRSGREVSRVRAVARLLVAWSPMLAFSALLAAPATRTWASASMVPAGIALGVMLAGVIWTAVRPTRGPHDIAAGTNIGVR